MANEDSQERIEPSEDARYWMAATRQIQELTLRWQQARDRELATRGE